MASSVRRVIDSYQFEFFHLSPKVALRVLARLTKIVGEPLGTVADVFVKGTGGKLSVAALLQMDMSQLPPNLIQNAVKSLLEKIDEDEVLQTIELVLERVYMQGDNDKGTRPIRFETDFAGKIPLLFKVLAVALEVNYGDFLGESIGQVVAAKMATTSTSV